MVNYNESMFLCFVVDVALNMVGDHLELATAKDVNNETALHALATKSFNDKTSSSSSSFNLCK